MSEIAADYQRMGVHHAIRPCLSCKGEGTVQGATCALCDGRKTYMVGCRAPNPLIPYEKWLKDEPANVDVDRSHYGMTECLDCGHFVPTDEVTVKE